ncbi:MAG TPA: multicopper oxidase family protein [Candidatus Limnocylindrales bacterium]
MVRSSHPRRVALVAAAIVITAAVCFGIGAPANAAAASAFSRPLVIPKVLTGSTITLTAAQADVQILPGTKTRMWTYNGSFPGPTIRRPAGKSTTVTLVNRLPAAAGSLTLHNHGNHSTSENDGQPDAFLADPGGGTVKYTYTGTEAGGNERGAFQWYHDHRMDVTGRNVWMGLAGMYIIDDPADPQTLPKGSFDVPLLIADRSFDARNQLAYRFDATGVTGDHVLVNGVPQPYFNVGDRKYRLRILNASNSRSYVLALSNRQAFIQIGTESGLLPAPVRRSRITIGPAERVEVVVDFARKLNQRIVLQNLADTGALRQLMEFRVTRHVPDPSSVPAKLRPLPRLDATSAATRTFEFGKARLSGRWTINGLTFDPGRVDAQPRLGTTETWIFTNKSGSNHIVHIHGIDQQLVSRNGAPAKPDEVMKESWNLAIGETIVLKLKFTDNVGKFVFHCHILEHEDAGMMAQYEVVPPS